MFGFTGKVLTINLSTTVRSIKTIDESVARNYLGGAGLGAHMLSSMDWSIDAFDPENRLAFIAGPLTGTPVPLCSRFSVCSKSPLTGIWGEAHASGFWGPELKAAGLDAVLIEGKAERPVYLFITNEKITLKDARYLWGMDAFETEEAIKAELKDSNVRVACIGPAENNVRD